MKSAVLKIEPREQKGGRKAKSLRRSGYIPSVIYGKEIAPVSSKIKVSDFRDSLQKGGRNAVFSVDLGEGNTYSVVIRDIQYDALKNDFMHIDFQQVSLTEKRTAEVPVRIVGRESVEAAANIINQMLDVVEVECLPQDTPEAVEIDVHGLSAGDTVLADQIKLPANVTLLTSLDEAVVKINESRASTGSEEDADVVTDGTDV